MPPIFWCNSPSAILLHLLEVPAMSPRIRKRPSVPIPKFASLCSTLVDEIRGRPRLLGDCCQTANAIVPDAPLNLVATGYRTPAILRQKSIADSGEERFIFPGTVRCAHRLH